MTTIKSRFSITVTDELLKEIDDFRYENRFPTRNQVANMLLRLGLEDTKNNKKAKAKRNKNTNGK